MTLSTADFPVKLVDRETLFRFLEAGHRLVTANSRLARILTTRYSQWRMDQGEMQWPSPSVLAWDSWLDELWESACLQAYKGTDRAVPGRQQLISLWEQVLRNDPQAQQLLRPESLAGQLRDTRKLLLDWRVDMGHSAWFGDSNENYSAFRKWNLAFERLCRKQGWVAPEDRSQVLAEVAHTVGGNGSCHTGLLGFDEYNPAQQELIQALEAGGHRIRHLSVKTAGPSGLLWKARSSKDELQRMARWVRYWFVHEPYSRIAVVVPDLRARRQEVERSLSEVLTPGHDEHTQQARPWNISLGIPLASVPMVESAFDLFRLLEDRIDIQDIGRVLRSPWISGGKKERNSRALLEKCLREKYARRLKLTEVWYRASEVKKYDRDRQELPEELQQPCAWNSPRLVEQIDAVRKFSAETGGSRSPSSWAESLGRFLSGLGWAAGDEETECKPLEHSDNWQAFQAWQDALRELASLDATVPRMTRRAALRQLQQICREQVFQPRTPDTHIQVLGLYEVSGLNFDHLWVLGLHNDNWPPAAQPNPFIPGSLQQSSQLPHSSPQRELEVARTVTQRLLQTADDCVFSYPGQLDGETVLPSPLLTGAEIEPVAELPAWEGENWQTLVSRADGPILDGISMPAPVSQGRARGGSSILKHQALCPFRAFASNRLGADGLETPVDGVSPALHGSLLHQVLEAFWKETRTQQALLALDGKNLHRRIQKHVENVVHDERSFNDRPAFRDVEADRLIRLANNCIELEKMRDPFEVVAFEQEIQHEIEGQTIRLVIDRIDRISSGGEAIIDYKTGKVDPKKWFGDRPEDPQLPLYSISAAEAPAAVAFAVIRDDECLFKGVATREGIFPGLPPGSRKHTREIIDAGQNMPLTIQTWRQTLHRLMADFLAGEASIDPKDGRKTCDTSYCELQSLCRVGELEQLGKSLNAGETG